VAPIITSLLLLLLLLLLLQRGWLRCTVCTRHW